MAPDCLAQGCHPLKPCCNPGCLSLPCCGTPPSQRPAVTPALSEPHLCGRLATWTVFGAGPLACVRLCQLHHMGIHGLSETCGAGAQLDEEVVQEKIRAVQQYRSMFVFSTQPQHPPSASDMIVELMCTNAKYGLRD